MEWSKNYRVRGGNVPFCYSVVWLALPASGASTGLDTTRFWYTSAYVEDASERARPGRQRRRRAGVPRWGTPA